MVEFDKRNPEIDLIDICKTLWKGKWVLFASCFLAGCISVFYAFSTPSIYRSEALLMPSSAENSGLGGLGSQLGGLASLAGVSLPSGGADKIAMGIEVLKSRLFFRELSEKYDVLVPLMASNGWDSSNNQLLVDSEIYDSENKLWVLDSGSPSLQEAHKVFLESLDISQDKDTGFVKIAIEHYSPYIAKQWVQMLVEEINNRIRTTDITEAKRSIEYLKEQVELTQLAEIKSGIFELIQSQTETIMLANSRAEYLLTTIDPAIVPEKRIKPKRALILVIGVLFGGIVGVIIVLTTRHSKEPK